MTIFSPQSKVWVYQSSRPFTEMEAEVLQPKLQLFATQWTAHNKQLKAIGQLLEHRFIVLMVDEGTTMASGCSIDTSVHFIQQIEKQFSVNLFDRMLIYYRKNNKIVATDTSQLEAQFEGGELTKDTLIYNPLVHTKSEFDEKFITALSNTWLTRYVTK